MAQCKKRPELSVQGNEVKSILREIIRSPQFPENGAWVRRTFGPNEAIINEGEMGSSLFLIESGSVRVTGRVDLENQHSVKPGICDLDAGSLFGEICLYQPHPRSASVVSITDVELIEVDGQRLAIFLDAHPVEGYLLLKELFIALGERLDLANHRVEKLFAWGLKAHGIEEHL
jgi:CRP-like cAMP-binding protein